MKKSGIELIAEERKEQLEKHGKTITGDVINNPSGQLAQGAVALIRSESHGFADEMSLRWDIKLCKKMAAKTYKERLIIAGALIAAEIDRLQSSCE